MFPPQRQALKLEGMKINIVILSVLWVIKQKEKKKIWKKLNKSNLKFVKIFHQMC